MASSTAAPHAAGPCRLIERRAAPRESPHDVATNLSYLNEMGPGPPTTTIVSGNPHRTSRGKKGTGTFFPRLSWTATLPAGTECTLPLARIEGLRGFVLQKVRTLHLLRAPGRDKHPSDLVIPAGRKGAYADPGHVGRAKSGLFAVREAEGGHPASCSRNFHAGMISISTPSCSNASSSPFVTTTRRILPPCTRERRSRFPSSRSRAVPSMV